MTSKQLNNTPLPSLKRIALEDLKVTKDQVREYGNLSYRQTWIDAILDIRDGIKQLTISDVPPSFSEKPDSPEPKNVEKTDITDDCHIAIELGWASPLAEPFIPDDIVHIIVDPAKLIHLNQTHGRFKDWQPWMDVGCQFTLPVGSIYTILYFDVWGFCLTLKEDSSRPVTLSLTTIATLGTPILKNNLQFKTTTSNELEVAALKNGLLHQGSKKNDSTCITSVETEAVPLDYYLIIEGESSQIIELDNINISPDEHPEIWEALELLKKDEKQKNYTINLTTFRQAKSNAYEVVQSSPEPDLYTFESSPESPSATVPKLPLEDYFKALFLGLPVLVTNQSA